MDNRVYILLEEFHHEYTDIIGVFESFDGAMTALDIHLDKHPHLVRFDLRVKAVEVQP